MPAKLDTPRWFMDENSLGPAKALQHVRGDITWPGQDGGPIPAGALDPDWLPVVGNLGLTVLTRDKRIRRKMLERKALLDHGVRACFLTGGGNLNLFDQLRLWLRWWDDIEELVQDEPAPWLASVTQQGVRLFDSRPAADTVDRAGADDSAVTSATGSTEGDQKTATQAAVVGS